MFNRKSNNPDIAQHDWARRDRTAMLRSLHAGRVPCAPAAVSSGWGTDVGGRDPRSAHAYLAGKGDWRSTWWILYSQIYLVIVPDATLEHAMYSFHRLHHMLTLTRLRFLQSVARMASDIEHQGLFAAVHSSMVREIKR